VPSARKTQERPAKGRLIELIRRPKEKDRVPEAALKPLGQAAIHARALEILGEPAEEASYEAYLSAILQARDEGAD
jgi:hypothetical protein